MSTPTLNPTSETPRRHSPDQFELFELEIVEIERAGGVYRARVTASPVRETTGAVSVDLSDFELENPFFQLNEGVELRSGTQRHARSLGVDLENLKAWGQHLFQTIFVGDLRKVLEKSIDRVRSQGRGLRICLRLDAAPELAALPWEALGNVVNDGAFGGDLDLLVARTLSVNPIRRPLFKHQPKKLRMLGLLPSPEGEEELSGLAEW